MIQYIFTTKHYLIKSSAAVEAIGLDSCAVFYEIVSIVNMYWHSIMSQRNCTEHRKLSTGFVAHINIIQCWNADITIYSRIAKANNILWNICCWSCNSIEINNRYFIGLYYIPYHRVQLHNQLELSLYRVQSPPALCSCTSVYSVEYIIHCSVV